MTEKSEKIWISSLGFKVRNTMLTQSVVGLDCNLEMD